VSVVTHGLCQSRVELSILAPFVPGTKVLFDFRGHGESDRPPPGSYSMDHFAGDIDAVASAYDASVLIGASLGGGAGLRLLMRDPDRFERVVILLPARLEAEAASAGVRMRLLRVADALERYPLEEATRRIMDLEEAEGAFDGIGSARQTRLEALLRMNRDGIPHAIREAIDDPPVRDLAPVRRVTAPAIVVGQEGDTIHTAEVARELADALPNAELIMFPDPQAMVREIPTLVARIAAFVTA
jgi:pimeloyl-ACP methyl ester carboxylesterase